RAVRVHHQLHVRPERLAREPQALYRALRKVRLVQTADADLDSAETPGAVAEHFINRLLRRGPAAAGIGRQAVAHAAAEETIDRYTKALAVDVPQGHVDAADSVDRLSAAAGAVIW